jgi:hypothetical protein
MVPGIVNRKVKVHRSSHLPLGDIINRCGKVLHLDEFVEPGRGMIHHFPDNYLLSL